MTNKKPAKQPASNGTLEALIASLQQAIDAKRQNDETIAQIRGTLAGHINEMQRAKAMVDAVVVPSVSTIPSLFRQAWSIARQWAMPMVLVLVLLFAFTAWQQESPTPIPAPIPTPEPIPPTGLNLTSAEARLVRSAIRLALDDAPYYGTVEQALLAFRALLPESTQERILRELGTPELFALRDALMTLDGKILEYE